MSDRSEDLALLRDAALAAGPLMREGFNADYEIWSKGAAGPVTAIDLAVDKMLKERLRAARPDFGWLSEETADNAERLSKQRVFVVDPIDGTRAFIKKKPDFVTALAIVEDGRAVVGVVYNPITEELYEAVDGHGATLNGAALRVSETAAVEGSRMIGAEDLFRNPRWPTPWPAMEITQKNAVAYRMALIATGAHDAMVALGWKSEWDIAAATVIVREAGGRVSDPWNGEITFNNPDPRAPGVVASGPRLHPSLIERVKIAPHPSTFPERPS
ncbi:MAG: 3'(2'),5'-bisphosphate nucleotidase CysQ [Hyphomonadaceae bacterium]|nr:3'(2'),5'-bisphosphate nucleotidase CysQ [Hyphomonadaceae bacterium]